MKDTKTLNVISTPNIEGNIGSCESKSVENYITRGIFTDEKNVVVTNSCTGQIIKDYNYTDYTGITSWIVCGGLVLFLFVGLVIGLIDEFRT